MFKHPPHNYLFVSNREVWSLGSLQQLHNIHTKFQKNQSAGPTAGMGTDQRTNTCTHTETDSMVIQCLLFLFLEGKVC